LRENQYIEDEIDLKELFNTIWQKRLFIAIFTFVVTICAVVYAYNKTPIYEVKSIIEIGFIDNQNKGISEKQFLEDPSVLEEKLNVIFNVNDKDINNDPYNGIISSISQVKTVKNFIEIKTEAVSNEIAKEKIKEILEYTKNLYNPKIQQYLTLANTDISNTEKEISFLKNEKIKMLSEKIESSKANLEKYNTEINSLYKSNSSDKLSSMIVSVQMVNYQNLIENEKMF
jgi:uncharacterized protein involved in exopolysaccharide biosynthesis